ncbi:hypothetical protein SESBI_41019 [Sesbania bispinosa]|nr:hypothetical protein SESBI_41019 [Sesbania bispinosa]
METVWRKILGNRDELQIQSGQNKDVLGKSRKARGKWRTEARKAEQGRRIVEEGSEVEREKKLNRLIHVEVTTRINRRIRIGRP